MIIIKLFLKFLKLLNSEAEPWQIAAGCTVGLFWGLTPLLSFHNLLLLIIIMFVRFNFTSALTAWGLFTAISFAVDPAADACGTWLLAREGLAGLWHFFSETPLLALFNLNHSLTLGSLLFAGILAAPVFFGVIKLLPWYRDKYKDKIAKWKLIKILKLGKKAELLK